VFHHFAGWQLIAHDSLTPDSTEPWDGRRLYLPAHIHIRRDGLDLDVQLSERSGPNWVLNREPRIAIARTRCAERSGWGVATLLPEIVLFYKAKEARPQDEADFRALLPYLTKKQAGWLREAIIRLHPGHSWLDKLRL
jgi:hypothetical protein